MLNGEERNHYTLKGFNDNAYVRFYYTTKPPMATPVEPADKQVLVTDQPTLRVNTIAPSDGDRIRYYFRVATNSDAQTGTVFNSGWIDSPTWTLPEGVLQDGMTYYWKAYSAKWSSDGSTYYNETGPNWVRSFKIDLRTGKDSTQSYDTAGPISVNLATGNATTSASTHSMAALGGNIGIGIDYNSPYASKQGLVAEYFSNRTFTGSPVVTRVESNVDNRWDLGSPSAGVVPTDNFSARYKGYFVAPKTGTYQFGANNDDTISIKLTINGVQQQVYSNSYCPGVCYGSSVTLNEGDAIPITVEYTEISGAATIRLYVKGAVPEQVIPPDMLRTAPRLVNNYQGLNAHYYYDPGNHTFPSSTNAAFLSRRETKISFNWGSGRPTPVGPADNWMARYDGYITVPTSGTYQFGAHNDDAVRIWINGQLVMDQWADDGNVGTQWGSNVYLDGGKAVPIRVEFYEKGGNAYLYLNVRGAVPEQEVPASWLSVKAPLLPNGWNISLDGDGSLKYDYAIMRPSSVLLVNADGTTHEYKWENNGYKPPVNEYGTLIKNNDGTLTLQDADGMTYVFAADGTLRSVTSPADDRRPVSLKFEYSSTPSRLTRIIDAVDPSRYGIVRYKGDSQCPSAPSGFDAEAPANMICAFETTDGRSTKFFYQGGQLARIELPGGEITDLRYDSLGRITQHRSSLAYDVVQAGLRADNAEVTTEISYDALGRVSKITEPAPNAGDARREHTYIYRPGAKTTDLRISNTSEPNGYTTRVEYDSLYRAVKVYDKTGNATQTEYDPVKDLVLSTTTPTGLKSTTIYDANDLPIDSYGPAPKEWFGSDRKPLAQYVGQVPRVQTSYDEGLIGPAVAWYNFKNDSLVGAPRIHATGFNPSDPSRIWINTTNSSSPPVPISPTDGATGVGFRAIGKIYASATGTYTLSLWHANAARIWVDDKLVLDGWSYRSNTVVNKTAQVPLTANKPTRFVFEYANAGGITAFRLDLSGNGVSITDGTWGNIMRPGYNLATSTKVYDSQIGDTVTTINYGSKPELGQVQNTVVDPSGLNLSTSFTYEPYQTGSLMRQTSKTLPGGTVTNYVYYDATETRDNPCTPETEAHKQAGFMKQKVEADPDGTGPQTPRTSEVVYDDAGRTVASRFNNDPWTCVTYDDRGRITKTVVPTINGRPGRTVTTNYNYQGNPLKTQVVDSVAGSTVSEIDLLGRTVSTTDQFGNVSTVTYDAQGRVASKITPAGTESYTYDEYDRVIEYKHNNTKYATVTYDEYSRVKDVAYDQAGTPTTVDIPGPNLIVNPSVETPDPNDPNKPQYWYSNTWSTNTAVFSYVNEGHTGNRSVKTQITSFTHGDSKWYFHPVDVQPNTNYTFRDYYKSNIESSVVVRFVDQSGANTYLDLGSLPASSDWTLAEYSFTTPANTAKVSVSHLLRGVGWLQIDDVDLHLTSQSTITEGVMKLEQIKRDALQRTSGAVFRFSDGTAFDETVNKSQSGKVTSYTDTFDGSTAGGTYTYDKAGRLIAANIDGNTYSYGYGAPTGCTGNFNPNAHKNSNRTSFTVNGVTTTYCYDQGDRLISSGDPQLGTPTYDDHGNTISLSGNGEPIIFTYDAADSNIAIQQGDYKVEYVKTASGSVLRKKEYQDGELTKSYRYLAGGAVLQTCNLTNDNDCVTTDTYLSLPGGVTLTLSNSPASSVSPNTPTIVAPTNGQHFSTSPILNKWDPPAGAENIVKYQVAYHYDDGHSFSNSTCPGLTMDGYSGFIGCRDVTGTERNHTPSVNEQGGLTIWVRAQYSDGSWSDWSAPVHYTYGTAVPPDVGYQGGQQALPSISVVYTIKNFHGDTAMTVGADGIPTSSVFLYEPFGQAAPSTTFGTNSNPVNATDESMGWAANPTRKVAGAFTIPIIQMGARVYLPTAGRFLQVDPIEGGTHNAYVYVTDPVNWHDYSGLCAYIIQCTATIEYFQPAAPVQTVQPASASSVLRSATSRRLTTTTSRAPSVGISIGYVAGGLSIAVDVASDAAAGVGRQSSVFGSKLRQGSSVAGKYLPTVSQLAKNPVIDVVGRVGDRWQLE